MENDISNLQIYSCYADSFVKGQKGKEAEGLKGNFYSLAERLEYIRNLGFNAIHVLPFFESPMKDGGFDVSDYFKVREELGGEDGWNEFRDKAKDLGLRIFVDFVLNHVSDEHKWFQRSIEGNKSYRDYFLHLKKPPILIETKSIEGQMYAFYEYKHKIIKKRVIFSHSLQKNPHWRQGYDGFWYYHSFYDHQLDLNWNNPKLFEEMVGVLKFWADQGCDFRLDAVPYIADTGLDDDHSIKVHEILQSLHTEEPESLFLVEATQAVGKMEDYFGSVKQKRKGKEILRHVQTLHSLYNAQDDKDGKLFISSLSSKERVMDVEVQGEKREADLLYNFNLMNKLWLAVLTEEVDYIWDALDEVRKKGFWLQWVNFLRNHDDLMVESTDSNIQKIVYDSLVSKGASFKQKAVSGRLASFLDGDESKILMAHFLLACLPGVPVMYYGDEIKIKNQEVRGKRQEFGDSREIHRGPIMVDELKGKRAEEFYVQVVKIFNTRLEFIDFINSEPRRLDLEKGLLGVYYGNNNLPSLNCNDEEDKNQKGKGYGGMKIMVNLTSKLKNVLLDASAMEVLSINGGEIRDDEVVLPGYSGVWIVVN